MEKSAEKQVVVGYTKTDSNPKDKLKRIGSSFRRHNDASGLVIVRGDFRARPNLAEEIEKNLWERHKILVTEKIHNIESHGLIVRIDSFMNEKKTVDAINRLLGSKASEIVYRPKQMANFDGTSIQDSLLPKKAKKSKAKKVPVPTPYSSTI